MVEQIILTEIPISRIDLILLGQYSSGGPGGIAQVILLNTESTILGSVNVNGGDSADIIAPNATAIVKDDFGNILKSPEIPSGASHDVIINDSQAVLKNTAATILSTTSINAEGSADIIAPNAIAVVKDDAGNILKSPSIPSGVNQNVIINDSVAVLKNTAATILSTTNINAEGSADITAPNAIAVVKDDSGNVLKSPAVPSGVIQDIIVNDSQAILKNTAATILSTTSINAEGFQDIIAPNAVANLKDTAGLLLSSTNVLSGASSDIIAPNSNAIIKNSLGTILSSNALKSNETKNINVNDSIISVNSVSFLVNPAEVNPNIVVKDTLGALVGSKVGNEFIVPSGSTPSGVVLSYPIGEQYTAYRTGDEGWRMQNGWYNYVLPTNPAVIAQLDRTAGANYWFKLKSALKVGGNSNTMRFVDVDGLQAWGATGNKDKITIDKFTGLGIYRKTADLGGASNWNSAIDAALSFSVVVDGVTYSDWYLISREEILAILGEWYETGSGYIYDIINSQVFWYEQVSNSSVWTSTTQANTGGANAYYKGWNPSTYITAAGKTATSPYRVYIFDARSLITAP